MSAPQSSLDVQNLVVGYGGSPIIQGLDLSLRPGEILGIVGPNGAGKSTLLKSLGGILNPDSGSIALGSEPITEISSIQRARQLAVVPQTTAVDFPFTVREFIEQGRFPHVGPFKKFSAEDHSAIDRAVERIGLKDFSKRRINELSGGELQRVTLARVLAQEASVILLDEPNAHLDLKYQQTLFNILHEEAKQGTAIMCVLHDLNMAAHHCHRLMLLVQGRTQVEGTPAEVLTESHLSSAYECQVIVQHDADGVPFVRHRNLPHSPTGGVE